MKATAGSLAAALAIGVTAMTGTAAAEQSEEQQAVLTAAESNPDNLGWMEGFPPSEDKIIRFTDPDYFTFPKLRWTVCHFRELMPTAGVASGPNPIRPLAMASDPEISQAIDDVTFTPWDADEQMTWNQAFDANYTDGVLVLHHGKIVYERYAGCLGESTLHGAMSVTKSLTGLLAQTLIAEGRLDEDAEVGTIIPELKDSAFGNATVRQVLEMTTSLDYSEDYADPEADVWAYGKAGSPLPPPEGYTGPRSYFGYLQTVKPAKDTEHGKTFAYKTINADALGWLIARTTGKSVAEYLSEQVWQRIGAEREAFYTVDSIGTPFAGGGFNSTLRDLGRFGQMMLDNGRVGDEQIIPTAAIERIRQGGDLQAFANSHYDSLKGWSYRSMWWITNNTHDAYAARGVHGQTIYIDPTADMVIVRFASNPVAANSGNDPTSLPAYQAVAEHLMNLPLTLVGGEWFVEDIGGAGIIDNTVPSLLFSSDGRVSGSATCNRIINTFETADAESQAGELTLGPLGTTMMACPEALMNQEQKMLELLSRIQRYDITEDGALVLTSESGETITARQRRPAPAPEANKDA